MKNWLENNKIYFDIVTSVLFGAAALFMSIASFNLSETQLELSQADSEPHFYVEETYIRDPKSNFYTEVEMKVSNVGKPISNTDISRYSFAKFSREGISPSEVVLPIIGFYSAQFKNQSPTGVLATFKGHENNHVASRLHSDLLQLSSSDAEAFYSMSLIHIIVIDYKNVLGQLKSAYFLNKRSVAKDDVEALIAAHQNQMPHEFNDFTAQKIADHLNNAGAL